MIDRYILRRRPAFAFFKKILQAQKKYRPLGGAVRKKVCVVCPIGMSEIQNPVTVIDAMLGQRRAVFSKSIVQ